MYEYFFETLKSYGSDGNESFDFVSANQAGGDAPAGQIERAVFRMAGI